MGRITIFSSDRCPHSKRTCVELQARSIPFTEIIVTKYPKKRADMLALSNRMSTPQVFFYTRHIGGADDTIKLLIEWDSDKKKHKTALERYKGEIERFPDPSNPRFAVPDYDPVVSELSLPRGEEEYCISVATGEKKQSVHEVLETLKLAIPIADNTRSMNLYKKTFVGLQGISSIMKSYGFDQRRAIVFFEQLVKEELVHHVAGKKDNPASDNLYRLQCHHTPNILNSYSVWQERVDPDAMRLINNLKDSLDSIEAAVTDDKGTIDLIGTKSYKTYSVFEEAVCELQGVQLLGMDDATKIAFGINLYNLMIKYAHIKVGVPKTDYDRFLYFNNVKFNVGGHIYSFQDWENGILRGNRKAPYVLGLQFGNNDPRLAFMVQNPDCRIHFALNCGARSCPPVRVFSVENLDDELNIVAMAYCEDFSVIQLDTKKNSVLLTEIFRWYRVDFAKTKKDLPGALCQYLRGTKKQGLERMLSRPDKIKIQFSSYDWSNNARSQTLFDPETLKDEKTGMKILLRSMTGQRVGVEQDAVSAELTMMMAHPRLTW